MKKLTITLCAIAMSIMGANAQTKVTYSDTQARMVEVTAKSYIKPLVGELQVVGGRQIFLNSYSKSEVEIGMNANADNLRSRAIYDATSATYKSGDGKEYKGWNCDAVVAATFKIWMSDDGKWYNVEMKGFAANFMPDKWHSLTDGDLKWLEMEKQTNAMLQGVDKSNVDKTNAGVVIGTVKK